MKKYKPEQSNKKGIVELSKSIKQYLPLDYIISNVLAVRNSDCCKTRIFTRLLHTLGNLQ